MILFGISGIMESPSSPAAKASESWTGKIMNFGTTEIILVVAVLFLLFGASRLPQLAKSLGQSRKAFKEGMREAEEEERAANFRRIRVHHRFLP